MKRFLAASLAALFVIGAAACAKKPAAESAPAQEIQLERQNPLPSESNETPETSEENIIRITPNQDDTDGNGQHDWLDEPETVQTDLEEIVSCTYTLPHLTLGSYDASAAANAVFDDLSQTVISYAQETVYPAAQEKQAIGYVNGGYSITEQDQTLMVSYTLSISYSTESGDQQFQHTYTIDLTTGELLKEE